MNRQVIRPAVMATLACAVGFSGASQAQERLLVQVPAVLDPSAAVIDTVKRECSLESTLGNWVLESVSAKVPGSAALAGGAQKGKVLKVTIVNVFGAGGGAWSGPKSMTVRADLMQSGKVIASTTKQRSSGGGAFGGMKGTCAIFGRVMKALGADVAAWV